MNPVFERTKKVHAVDYAAIVIGLKTVTYLKQGTTLIRYWATIS
jgi:hypothetical protein